MIVTTWSGVRSLQSIVASATTAKRWADRYRTHRRR